MSQIVNSLTSFVQVDSSGLENGGTAVVYVSSAAIPGQLVTILDATGYLSSPQAIQISAIDSVFQGGSPLIQQRFGFVTLHGDMNTWTVINENSFPDPTADAVYKSLHANSVATESLTTSLVSTNQIIVQGLNKQSTLNTNPSYISTLYVNTTLYPSSYSLVTGRAYVGDSVVTGNTSFRGSISTGGDLFTA
jgi:hypothetical protein